MLKVSICLLVVAGICAAQNKEEGPRKFDRLDFVLKEVDGSKVVNSRAYSAIMEVVPSPRGISIRAESRLPVATSPQQWQNFDLGVSIDTSNAHEIDSGLAVHVSAEIKDIAPNGETAVAGMKVPITRQMKWSSDVVIPLRKPTTIFSSDDPTSKHKMQLELTATPIS